MLGTLFGSVNDFEVCVSVCVHYGEVRELNGRMQNATPHRTAESFLFAWLEFVYERILPNITFIYQMAFIDRCD